MMKVLVAMDCSECSLAAVRAVMGQFRPGHVEFYLLHVIDPMMYVPLSEGAVHDSKRVEALREVNFARAHDLVTRGTRLLVDAGHPVQSAITEGEPRTTIVAYAKHIQADVIVVGSHGRRGLRRLLLGSVSEYVARHAPCTVQIIRRLSRAA